MARREKVSDEQWKAVSSVLQLRVHADHRGRLWRKTRSVFNGVLWVLGSGASYRPRTAGEVPAVSGLQPGQAGGVAEDFGASSARARQAEPRRGVRGCDFHEREKGYLAVGPTNRSNGAEIVAIADANSLPLAVSVQSATPAECKLVEEVLAGSFLDERPARLTGDKAYDSDALDSHLADLRMAAQLLLSFSGTACTITSRD
jgi:transposase